MSRSAHGRNVVLLVLLAVAVLAGALLVARGGGAHDSHGAAAKAHTTAVGGGARGAAPARREASAKRAARVSAHDATRLALERADAAGSLAQTQTVPAVDGARFKSRMRMLWSGVVHDSVADALPAFFPVTAYQRLKAIYGAASDWSGRLVRDFGLDLGAAHALLGADARGARLLRVEAHSSYAHWVPAGVCDNSIGYYELPNARVLYAVGARVRSFGIASLISWRGEWYVVHLGAVLRPADVGEVDEAAAGAGVSAYSGTC